MGLIKRTVRKKVKQPVKRAVRRKVTRPARRKAEHVTSVKCGTCGKRYTNPLTHTCTVKTDFRKRKAAAGRQAKRERAKARRKAAADRRKAAAAARRQKARSTPAPKRAPQHDYRTCDDGDCRRAACAAFKEGIEACPLEHV